MNIFQRLSYLKKWSTDNSHTYQNHLQQKRVEFEKYISSEKIRLQNDAAIFTQKISAEIISEKSMTYDIWVEKYFQGLIKQVAKTDMESIRSEFIDDFKVWLNNYAKLDYNLRTIELEKFYQKQFQQYDIEVKAYLKELEEQQIFWLEEEDSKFHNWLTLHPLTKELRKIQHLYDNMSDSGSLGKNLHFNNSNKKKDAAFQKRIIDRNNYNVKEVEFSFEIIPPSLTSGFIPAYFK